MTIFRCNTVVGIFLLTLTACTPADSKTVPEIISSNLSDEDKLNAYGDRLSQISANPVWFFAELDKAGFDDPEPDQRCSVLRLPIDKSRPEDGYRAFVNFCQNEDDAQIQLKRMGLGNFTAHSTVD